MDPKIPYILQAELLQLGQISSESNPLTPQIPHILQDPLR